MPASPQWALAFPVHASAMGEVGGSQAGAIPVVYVRVLSAIPASSWLCESMPLLWEKLQGRKQEQVLMAPAEGPRLWMFQGRWSIELEKYVSGKNMERSLKAFIYIREVPFEYL